MGGAYLYSGCKFNVHLITSYILSLITKRSIESAKFNAAMLVSGRSVLFVVKNSFLRHPEKEGMKQVS